MMCRRKIYARTILPVLQKLSNLQSFGIRGDWQDLTPGLRQTFAGDSVSRILDGDDRTPLPQYSGSRCDCGPNRGDDDDLLGVALYPARASKIECQLFAKSRIASGMSVIQHVCVSLESLT